MLTKHLKPILALFIMFLTIGVALSQGSGQSGIEIRRAPLIGLKGVVIAVEPSEALSKAGLTTADLTAEIDTLLRGAGVTIMPSYEQTAGALYIAANVLPSKDGNQFSYNVSVEVWQTVTLVRNPNQSLIATTWSVGSVGAGTKANLKDRILGAVQDHVNEFLSDYQAANNH